MGLGPLHVKQFSFEIEGHRLTVRELCIHVLGLQHCRPGGKAYAP